MGFKILSVTFLPLSISPHPLLSELERIMMIPVIKTLCLICLALAQGRCAGKIGCFVLKCSTIYPWNECLAVTQWNYEGGGNGVGGRGWGREWEVWGQGRGGGGVGEGLEKRVDSDVVGHT